MAFMPDPSFGAPAAPAAPQQFDLNESVMRNAAKHGVDPNLVRALIKQESGGQQGATSSKGARGIMQLMPSTAAELGVDMNDPEQNVEGGVRYLGQMLNRYGGDVEKGLAAYNAGPGTVDKYGGVPPFRETVDYVKNVSAALMGPQPQVEPQPVGPPAPEAQAPASKYQPDESFTSFNPTEFMQRQALESVPDATVPLPETPEKSGMLAQFAAGAAEATMSPLEGLARRARRNAYDPTIAIEHAAAQESQFNQLYEPPTIPDTPVAIPPMRLPGDVVRETVPPPAQDDYWGRGARALGSVPPMIAYTAPATAVGGPVAGAAAMGLLNAGMAVDANEQAIAAGQEPPRSETGALIGGAVLGGTMGAAGQIPNRALRYGVEAGLGTYGFPVLEGRDPQFEDYLFGAGFAAPSLLGKRPPARAGEPAPLEGLPAPQERPALPAPGDVIHGQDLRGQSGPPINIPPNTPQLEGANPAQRQIPDLRNDVIQLGEGRPSVQGDGPTDTAAVLAERRAYWQAQPKSLERDINLNRLGAYPLDWQPEPMAPLTSEPPSGPPTAPLSQGRNTADLGAGQRTTTEPRPVISRTDTRPLGEPRPLGRAGANFANETAPTRPEIAPLAPTGNPPLGGVSRNAARPLTEQPARPEQTAAPLEVDPVRAAAAELTAAQKATAAAEKAYNKNRSTANADALRAASAAEQAASAKLQQAMTGGRNATQEGVQPRNEVSQYPRDEGSGTPTEPVRSGSNESVRQEPTQIPEPAPPPAQRVTTTEGVFDASRMQDVREDARPTEAQGQSAPQGKGQSPTQGQREGATAPYDAEGGNVGNGDVTTRRTTQDREVTSLVGSGPHDTPYNKGVEFRYKVHPSGRKDRSVVEAYVGDKRVGTYDKGNTTKIYVDEPTTTRNAQQVDADIARLQEVRDSDAPASERRKAERQLEKLYEEYNKLVEEESGRALNPGQLVDKVLSKFRSRGDLPRDLDRLVQQRKGQLNAADRGIEFALIDLDRAMRKTYGRKPTPANIDLMRAVLEGRAAVTQLPTELQGPMTALRKGDVGIDTLSDYMVQNNLVTGDLAKTISQNTGKYTHREYRAFDTPNWEDILRRDNPTVVNTAKAEIRKANLARWQAAGKTPKQINELVEGAFIRLVNKGDAKNLNEFMNAKLGHEDLGFLKRRKNLPDWVRKALGEYEDPRAIYATSASGASHFIVNKKFLDAVKQVGFDKYFHNEPIVKGDTRYTEKLGNKAVFGDLADLYTTKEIKAEFENAFEPREMSKMVRGILAANGVVKYGATIGNVPQGYVRNATSNPLLVLANGNINPVHAPKTFKVMASRLFDRGNTATRKEEMRLVRLGVLGDSANFGEFRAAINDVVGHSRSVNDFQHNALVRAAKYTGHTLTRWWAAIDDVFKAFNFYSEEAKYRKAYPNWTPEQVARKAAELTSAQMPTYSRAPKIVQTLRHNPVIAPFATFPAEVTRNTFNIAYQAAKEIRDPATRSIGLQRAAGLAAAIAAAATLDQMSQEQAGISDQDVKDLRKFMPPYSKDAPIMWLGKDAKGNQKYVDMTYMAPHTILTKPLKAAMDEGTPLEKVENMLKTGLEPYYSPELLPQRIWQAAKNDSPRVYNPEDTRAGIATDVGKYVGEAFIPGAGKAARRIKQAATGEVGPSGQQYNLSDELTSTFTGARKQRVDVLRSLSFKASEYAGTKSNTTRLFTDTSKSKQAVTKEELKGDYAKSAKQKQARFDEIVDLARAAVRLGHPAKDVIKALTEGGVGKEEALYILLNRQPKYTPSQDALVDSYKAGGTQRLVDTITATVGEQ